ncbi:MAG: hypothetical protein LRY51_18280 [Geovibrio sp.]|nr:hypothetical protein [Geovibrio sp.]
MDFTDAEPADSVANIAGSFTVFVPLQGLIDVEAEIKKLEKEQKTVEKDLSVYGGKLKNEKYLANAAPEIIEKDKKKFEEATALAAKIEENLRRLKSQC